MDVIIHDAVIVTAAGYIRDNRHPPVLPDIDAFRSSLPEQWRPLVIGPIPGVINDYLTWVFLPDGSKEDWQASDQGDEYRARFATLFAFAYEDGSSPFKVVHVRYGADLEDAGPVAWSGKELLCVDSRRTVRVLRCGDAPGFLAGEDHPRCPRPNASSPLSPPSSLSLPLPVPWKRRAAAPRTRRPPTTGASRARPCSTGRHRRRAGRTC